LTYQPTTVIITPPTLTPPDRRSHHADQRVVPSSWPATIGNNLYGLLYGSHQPDTLAPLLIATGWSARKAAWDEFEITNEWCSFLLVSSGGQVQISGVIAPESLDRLAAAFETLGLGYELEVYSGAELVRQAVRNQSK